jgi:polysaccharide biosynthesis/export protein
MRQGRQFGVVLLVVTLLMIIIQTTRIGTRSFCRLSVPVIIIFAIGSGCNNGAYRVSNLPAECMAPSTINAETINLAGLADTAVSSQIIQLGDVLELTMVTDYEKMGTTTTPVRVANDGTVIVPLVGKVGVVGLEVEQAEQIIAAESIARGVYRNPCITLTMKQCRTNKITVVGAVDKPGAVDLPRASSSVLNALVAAGGLTKDADSEVEIRRTDARNLPPNQSTAGNLQAADKNRNNMVQASYQQQAASGPPVIRVNLNSVAAGAEQLPDLHDGDVVYVAKRTPKPIYVIGLVRKPGEYPYPINQEIRVLDAIALAGGCSNALAEDVLVIRRPPGKAEPVRIAVGIQAAKQGQDNVALAPGDTVSVEQSPPTAVLDFIQNFIRVGFGATMSMF